MSCSDSATRTVADAYVVDTGVFLRWFVDRNGYENARLLQQKLVDGSVAVETVDFARVEVAGELDRPLLPIDLRLRRAAAGSVPIEILSGIEG